MKVERRAVREAAWRFEEALDNSEDSPTLNTLFIERLNLTIRQSLAYLSRRTLSHARAKETLGQHLELLRCYYNFVRPYGALKFGSDSGDAGRTDRAAPDAQGVEFGGAVPVGEVESYHVDPAVEPDEIYGIQVETTILNDNVVYHRERQRRDPA